MVRNQEVSRRNVLRSVAAGAVGVGLTGAASGATGRHIVGAASAAAVEAARGATDSLFRVVDLGEYGTLVAGVFPSAARNRLEDRGDVKYVQPDRQLRTLHHRDDHDGGPPGDGGGETSQTLPWGIDRVDADVAHGNGETGNGADIAIIDTGIDSDHPDLQANLGSGKAFTTCKGSPPSARSRGTTTTTTALTSPEQRTP